MEISPKEMESQMSDVATAQSLMHEAFPIEPGSNAKARIWEAYRKLKLRSVRRARSIWNGEAKRIDHHEMTALQAAVLKRARIEHARTRDRIASLETALRVADENYFSDQIGALRRMAGRSDRPMD